MESQKYLIFGLNDLPYGIKTAQVREIFRLPELTPIADAPGDIIGILNFRGAILPVMHLAKRLGQTIPPCHLNDRVIVIEWQGFQVGMVVHQVYDVQPIDATSIEPEPDYGHGNPIHTAFVAGVAKIEDQLITLLNPETLIRQTDGVALMIWEERLNSLDGDPMFMDTGILGDETSEVSLAQESLVDESMEMTSSIPVPTNFFDLHCHNSTPHERAIFHERALELRRAQHISNPDELMPLAVVGLGEEYFALALDAVREFINIRQVTSIPCCPSHIVGDINLRGEVMTLVDIRNTLNLAEPEQKGTKAIVIKVDDIIAGITVDQVLDVIYIPPSQVTTMPTAVRTSSQDFFQGTTPYHQKTLSILDLPKLFVQGNLIVDQAA